MLQRWLTGILFLIMTGTAWAAAPSKVSIDFAISADNSVLVAPGTIAMSAEAWTKQQSHPVVKVEFYQGSTLIGTASAAPYTATWSNIPAGSYTLTARAISDKGDTADSPPVTVDINAPPTVSLASPASNTAYTAPGSVTLTAAAADSDGSIAKVDYYQNGQLIGTATTAPYSLAWSNIPAGSYSVTAVATDNQNASATSAPVSLAVYNPPTVGLTAPADGSVQAAPASFTLTADASAANGRTLTQVAFYQGSTLIGTVSSAPYSLPWNGVPEGSYSLIAQATDDLGGVGTSAPITVVSNAAPVISLTAPAGGTALTAPGNLTLTANAVDSDGSIAQVDYYQNGQLIGTATTAPYSVAWNDIPAGSYSLTAQATDNHGATTITAPVAVGVYAPPTVSLAAPSDNTIVTAPGSVTLTADAAAASGRTLTQVAFYQGSTLIGTATAAPYTYTWNTIPAGSYSLTAQATDDLGAITTSAPITFIANQAPTVSLTAPADNSSVIAPATVTLTASATDSDGSIAQVEFYEGANLLATVTTAPYTYDWNVTQPGSYTLFAKVTDNHGSQTTATAVHLTVAANQAPTINITAPAPNTSYTTPASIHLTASATDADGSITQVAFYQNGQLLTTLTAAPYAYDWTGVQPGTYQLTAQATDDRGLTTTSTTLTLTVTDGIPLVYYIHTDQLDTPRAITDQANTIVWRWDSDPFGATPANEDPDGNSTPFEFNLRFPGQYADKETGLHYNYFRDYDPTTGRYIESDPIGLAGGSFSTYAYTLNNPLVYDDPLGLDVTINIRRDTYGPVSIIGTIDVSSTMVSDTYTGNTLEDAVGGSCRCKDPVSAGTYSAKVRKDHSPNRVELIGVPNYSNVQIHIGNDADDVEGCFAVGNSRQKDYIGGSKDALNKINDIIRKDATENITVNVIGSNKQSGSLK